ncbi:SpaA isopeptide-forming pilin-related protein [Streptococcus hillyeri]|uniref:SpaA isopeptide-forming pilin-related protein n=1 Tax=Streptococcus hillyeri TaxID=2282420 RepID=UPI0034E1EA05
MRKLRKIFHKAVACLCCLSQLTVFSTTLTSAEVSPANPSTGKIVVRETSDSGTILQEAIFTLTNQKDGAIVSQKTDSQTGDITFTDLVPGTYILTETQSPVGYHPSKKQWLVNVKENGETIVSGDGVTEREEVLSPNYPQEGVYEDDKTKYNFIPVDGSQIGEQHKAWNPEPSERIIDEGTLSKKIYKVNDLEENSYGIELTVSGETTESEKTTIEEGVITDPIGEMIELQLGKDGLFDSTDYTLKGSDGSYLENGQAIGGPQKDGGVLKQAQVSYDDETKTLRVTGLTLGTDEQITLTYNIHLNPQFTSHTLYSTNGRTTLHPKGVESEIVRDFPIPQICDFSIYKNLNIREYPEITVPKERKLGKIEFRKYAFDTSVNDQGQLLENNKKLYLEGGQFELWKLNPITGHYEKDNNHKIEISAAKTGKFVFDKISPGQYRVKEIVSPPGYKDTHGAFVAEFTYTEAAEFENVTPTTKEIKNVIGGDGKVELTKMSRENGVEDILPGATFVIKDSKGNILDTQKSDNTGRLTFSELPYGIYYIEETKAPSGYERDKEPLRIYVGPDFDVPKNAVGKDVGDKVHATSGSIKSYDFNNDELIHKEVIPGQAGYLRINSEFTFDVTAINKEIKPGDYFKVKLSENLSIGGLTPDEQVVDLDIVSSAGVVAKGKYDKTTHTLTYTFTNYVENYILSKAGTSLTAYIDKKVVTDNRKVLISRSVLKKGVEKDTVSATFSVVYKGYARIKAKNYNQHSIGYHQTMLPSMGSLVTKVDEEKNKYTAYVYYNVNGDSIAYPRLNLIDTGDTINPITETTRVRIYRVNAGAMKPSFGYYEDADGNPLTGPNGRMIGEKVYDGFPKERQILLETSRYLYRHAYIVKVDGDFSDNPGNIKIEAYGDGLSYNGYRYSNRVNAYVVLNSNSSEAEGEVGLKIINKPNQITFTKTGLDDKPLPGAKFELRKKNENGHFDKVEGSERTSAGADGTFNYSKLAYGEYEVWETAVSNPNYILPNKAVATFKVNAEGRIIDVTPEDNVIRNSVSSKLKIIKQDADDTKVKLKDAVFELYKLGVTGEEKSLSKEEFEKLSADEQKGYIYSIQKGGITTTKWTTNNNGEVVIEGLVDGVYVLKEAKAPKGYGIRKETMGPIIIENGKVRDSPENESNDIFKIKYNESDSAKNTMTVHNRKLSYPSTGGLGISVFMMIGGFLMFGSVFWYRKRYL